MSDIAYDREVFVIVLTYHWRCDDSSCGCGWAELGRSHSEHVAKMYEQAMESDRIFGKGEWVWCKGCPDALEAGQKFAVHHKNYHDR